MIKKAIIIAGFILAIILWNSHASNPKSQRETIIKELENYKATNGYLPESLNELSIKFSTKFDYNPDSTFQYYYLYYSYGVIDCNSAYYDSHTKKWEEKFNF